MNILTSPGPLSACALAVGALVSACSSIGQPAAGQPPPAVSPDKSDAGSSDDLGLSRGRVGSGALAFPPDAASPLDAAIAPDASLPADPNYLLLPFGVAETLVDGVTAAEDAMFSTDERLFVTGNDGIYELQRNPSGNLRATNLHPGEKCVFTGIVEVGSTLYATCADYTNSYLFAASLAGAPATPAFRKVYTMAGTVLANEITADPDGRIYVAASAQGKIVRLQLSPADPFTVAQQEDWLSTPSGIFPNGLKYFDSSIYWTDSLGGSVSRAFILLDGTAGPITSFIDPGDGFFDDLYVNSNGTMVVASYLLGTLRAYGPPPLGGLFAQTPPGAFTNPADVLPALGRFGFGTGDLIVTDKGANRVVLFHLPF
jgi:hypothetical protein